MTYEEKETTLGPGDTVLLHSDGLVEAHDPERTMFGFPRLVELMNGCSGGLELIRLLLAELDGFTGPDWEQEDDITLVALQRAGGHGDAANDPELLVLPPPPRCAALPDATAQASVHRPSSGGRPVIFIGSGIGAH